MVTAPDNHDARHERHCFKVAGRTFALDIDHGHKADCCMLPPVPASVVWWEDLTKPGASAINCGDTRTCLMIEGAD